MSLEAITKIRAVEESAEQAKANARAEAQKLLADTEREGREMLQKGKEESAKAAAEIMRKAQDEAAALRESILAQAAEDCKALKADAGGRMDKATQAILGRVVGS